jgi:tetratricopeptide (TPR) repeat protein
MNDFEIGNQCYMSKDYEGARDCYERFLQTEPENYVAWHNLGVTYCQLGLDEQALEAFVLPCKHNYVESHLSRGTALRNLGRYREALIAFSHTFSLDPKHPTAYSNYGNTLREFLEPELAIPFMQIARRLRPNYPNFELNECVCHLMKGDLLAGWELYESRWYFQSDTNMKPNLPGPEYNGSQDINGKSVLVYYEQGFGDNIQFVRYVKLLRGQGANVLLVTKKPTYELFKYNFPDVEVIDSDSILPGYHFHVALMDLPKCFKTTIDTIPYPTPYLDVDEGMKQSWKTKLGIKTKKRIGLLSSPNKVAYITKFRRIELEKLGINREEETLLDELKTTERAILDQSGDIVAQRDLLNERLNILEIEIEELEKQIRLKLEAKKDIVAELEHSNTRINEVRKKYDRQLNRIKDRLHQVVVVKQECELEENTLQNERLKLNNKKQLVTVVPF